ncbi:MAG: OmpA family protein [Pseudomonadota bacterium]|nr:OmpA family protein [Pseudomonadota bacterium]
MRSPIASFLGATIVAGISASASAAFESGYGARECDSFPFPYHAASPMRRGDARDAERDAWWAERRRRVESRGAGRPMRFHRSETPWAPYPGGQGAPMVTGTATDAGPAAATGNVPDSSVTAPVPGSGPWTAYPHPIAPPVYGMMPPPPPAFGPSAGFPAGAQAGAPVPAGAEAGAYPAGSPVAPFGPMSGVGGPWGPMASAPMVSPAWGGPWNGPMRAAPAYEIAPGNTYGAPASGNVTDGQPASAPDGDDAPAANSGSPADASSEPAAKDKLAKASLDTDRDGVSDYSDLCPDTGAGARVDDFGCEAESPIVLRGVKFLTDSDRLTPESTGILDSVAETLKSNPDVSVGLNGYTDTDGDATYNKDLSQRRANTVMAYLVMQGVEADNLVSKGYGEENPIASNDTPDGKATNRRVELTRLSGE